MPSYDDLLYARLGLRRIWLNGSAACEAMFPDLRSSMYVPLFLQLRKVLLILHSSNPGHATLRSEVLLCSTKWTLLASNMIIMFCGEATRLGKLKLRLIDGP